MRIQCLLGEIGQTLGKRQRLRLALIEPQQTYQLFPAGRDLVLGRAQAGGGIGIKSLLASTGNAVEVAHALHAFG